MSVRRPKMKRHLSEKLSFYYKIWRQKDVTVLREISILGTREYDIRKNKGSFVLSTFKIDITKVPLFFQISYLLVPK